MTYGKSKERDMVRSILPSSARKSARDRKNAIKRAHRSSVRQTLRQHRDTLACEMQEDEMFDRVVDFDAPYAELIDADGKCDNEIKYAMWDRREADKTRPFERWAVAQTKGVRLLDRATWLQSKMPDTLAVRHAMSHVRMLDEFEVDEHRHWWRNRFNSEESKWIRAAEYAQAVEDLYEVCAGRLGRFNSYIPRVVSRDYLVGGCNTHYSPPRVPWRMVSEVKSSYQYWDTRQTWLLDVERLQGAHHIEEWIAYIAKTHGIDNHCIGKALSKL